jgi:RNA 2',3'-cyclic 3'-phosphodiesterase
VRAKRLFIAIDIKPEPEFNNFIRGIKKQLDEETIKWVDEKIFHLTLKFLGDTDENRIGTIKSVLSEICKNFNPFSFETNGLGFFGSKNDPRILFSKVEGDQSLKELSALINEKLLEQGFEKEQKEFKPHLTLGRIKHIGKKMGFFSKIENQKDIFLQTVKTKEVILYESILKQNGPKYIPIERFLLLGREE